MRFVLADSGPGSYKTVWRNLTSRLAMDEQLFDTTSMLTVHDVESIRRSAAMAPLSSDEAFRMLETCDQLLRERAQIAEVLADLPASWAKVRKVLNERQAIVG
jgi:hypothetical protein